MLAQAQPRFRSRRRSRQSVARGLASGRAIVALMVALTGMFIVGGPAWGQASTPDPTATRVVQTSPAGPDQVGLLVSPPRALSLLDLDAGNITVRDADGPVPAKVERLASNQLDVIVAIDIGSSEQESMAALGAADELVRTLPADAQVGVTATTSDPGDAVPLTNDRPALLAAIARLEGFRGRGLAEAVSDGVDELQSGAGSRDTVIAISAGSVVDAAGLRTALDQSDVEPALYLAAAGSISSDVEQVAEGTGGLAVPVDRPGLLIGATDDISSELGSQYRLDLAAPTDPGEELTVQVAANDVEEQATVTLAGGPAEPSGAAEPPTSRPEVAAPPPPVLPAAPASGGGRGGLLESPAVLAVIAAFALAAMAAGGATLLRRRAAADASAGTGVMPAVGPAPPSPVPPSPVPSAGQPEVIDLTGGRPASSPTVPTGAPPAPVSAASAPPRPAPTGAQAASVAPPRPAASQTKPNGADTPLPARLPNGGPVRVPAPVEASAPRQPIASATAPPGEDALTRSDDTDTDGASRQPATIDLRDVPGPDVRSAVIADLPLAPTTRTRSATFDPGLLAAAERADVALRDLEAVTGSLPEGFPIDGLTLREVLAGAHEDGFEVALWDMFRSRAGGAREAVPQAAVIERFVQGALWAFEQVPQDGLNHQLLSELAERSAPRGRGTVATLPAPTASARRAAMLIPESEPLTSPALRAALARQNVRTTWPDDRSRSRLGREAVTLSLLRDGVLTQPVIGVGGHTPALVDLGRTAPRPGASMRDTVDALTANSATAVRHLRRLVELRHSYRASLGRERPRRDPAVVDLLIANPVITTRFVSDRLGIAHHEAFKLVGRLEQKRWLRPFRSEGLTDQPHWVATDVLDVYESDFSGNRTFAIDNQEEQP